MIRRIWDALQQELSGDRARAHVSEIGNFYRSPGSTGYHAAVDYVADVLRDMGAGYQIEQFPLDGHSEIGGARMPPAWEPCGGSLELVGERREVLIEWDDCASCLPWWCPPTPPGGVELEVIDVGTGTLDEDYVGKDVAGKAVLVHDAAENLAWLDIMDRAERHGAVAVITNYLLFQYSPWRTRETLPDAVQQLRLRPRTGNPWTFSVSHPVFERLLEECRREPTVVRLAIDTKTFEGSSRSVLTTIEGETPESVLLVAHVSAGTKPGANCASGVGLQLELIRSLRTLIRDGVLPRPKRTLHFLFCNEHLGSVALAQSHPELRSSLLVAFSFCSVGHDQGRSKSTIIFSRSPDSLPTFVNEVVESLIDLQPGGLPWAFRAGGGEIPYVRWKVLPYTPWADNSTWSKLGVPAVLFTSLPDRYFHTQLLTVEETDPVVFASTGVVAGTAAFACANAGWPDVGQLMRRVITRSEARMYQVARESYEGLDDTEIPRALDALDYLADRDVRSMRSALRLVVNASREPAEALADQLETGLRDRVVELRAELTGGRSEAFSATPAPSGEVVPLRIAGKLPLHGELGLSHPEVVALAAEMARRDRGIATESMQLLVDELWNLSSGELDLGAITRMIGHEFGFDLDAEHVHRLAQGLARDGFLELVVK